MQLGLRDRDVASNDSDMIRAHDEQVHAAPSIALTEVFTPSQLALKEKMLQVWLQVAQVHWRHHIFIYFFCRQEERIKYQQELDYLLKQKQVEADIQRRQFEVCFGRNRLDSLSLLVTGDPSVVPRATPR